ncbi:MAG: valine--tRNA ligase [Candidatus Levyibacteriota bacterium]
MTEEQMYDFWQKNGFFKADPKSSKKPYSILMPPPNLTGELHLGHAMQHSILDAIARFKRMQGFDVLLLPGVDHAGILFEGTLNKILEKEGLSKQKLGREKWLERAWQFKDKIYKSFHKTWSVFGLSADWSREVFTLDQNIQKAVFEEFKRFWEEGTLYKSVYIVQWCPKCGTAIEDVEMEYQERKEKLYYLKYGPLVLATTRPETKFGDTAMAVNPNDKRYQKHIGKEFEIDTLAGKRKMKVIADDAIDPKFGTGAEKVTPGHDILDYEIGKRHNLPIINVIDKKGRLTKAAGKYAGMKILEARKVMLPELKEKGILIKEEDYIHSVPVCERCHNVVEPTISEEWFLKTKSLAQKALDNINKIDFIPKSYQKIISNWLEEIHDWCISRNLWWGHRIPIWYKGNEVKVSIDSPGEGWVQEEKILDTWFSSGMWPLITLGWPFDFAQDKPSNSEELKRYYPWAFELSAPEIKFLWIARMIMLGLHFKNEIPFKNMFFHGMLRDLEGRKFSKSLGNGIDPNQLRQQWGTDSVRMALYSYSAPGRDGKTSRQLMDERCKNFRNFGTKMRNIYRFVMELSSSHPEFISGSREILKQVQHDNVEDKEIIEKLNKTIKSVTKNLESFNLHLATQDLYDFIWHDFADDYIEKSKKRRKEAQATLEYVLMSCLRLLHPFMPFLTEELYQKMPDRKKSIMLDSWPKA